MALNETLAAYHAAGWNPLPVPPRSKKPVPAGFTGVYGADVTPADIEAWCTPAMGVPGWPDDSNVALRMPDGVIGIDVDTYDGKTGDATLAGLESALGPLPPTFASTSRGDEEHTGPSCIRFYRTPLGLAFRGVAGESIEVVQRRHRYAMAYPSVHPSGRVYRWYTPDGRRTDGLPHIDDLAELPDLWRRYLETQVSETGQAGTLEQADMLLGALTARVADVPCADMTSLCYTAAARMAATGVGGRHDAMTALTYRLVATAAAGHPGYAGAAEVLRQIWDAATNDEHRSTEYSDMLTTAARKVAGDWPEGPGSVDPCQLAQMVSMEPPRMALDLAHAGTDRTLAKLVLMHVRGGVRYLTDTQRWLQYGVTSGQWYGAMDLTSPTEGARVILNRCLNDALRGDPNAPDGSDEKRRAANYSRLSMATGANAAASMMVAYARDPDYPHAITLSELDNDPMVLWAGGTAWDLERSVSQPAPADIDPRTPHLKSAPYAPRLGDAPRWDAFLEAVLPDEGQRAWVLSLLGATLVGVPDRALLVLYGGPGVGKTQLLSLVSDVIGTSDRGYATAADRRLLGDDSTHASVLMALSGRRLAWIDEGPRRGKSSIERLKALTGGGQMTANAMRANPVTFTPTHTLAMTTNDEPEVTDEALRSRIRLIECLGDAQAVRRTRAALGDLTGPTWRREAPVVLGRLMVQAGLWLGDRTRGDNPLGVVARLEALAAEQDTVQMWVLERCTPAGWTSSAALYEEYRGFARAQGVAEHRIESAVTFGRALSHLGVQRRKGNNGVRECELTLRRYGGAGAPRPTPAGTLANVLSPALQAVDNHVSNPVIENPGPPAGGPFGETASATSATPHNAVIVQECSETLSPLSETVADVADEGPFVADVVADENLRSGGIAPSQGHVVADEADVYPRLSLTSSNTSLYRAQEGENHLPHAPQPALPSLGENEPARTMLPAIKLRGHEPFTVDLATADAELRRMAPAGLTIDVEHTGYPIGHPDYALRTAQLGDASECVVLDMSVPSHRHLVGEMLTITPRITAHSATADIIPTALALGLDTAALWAKASDTAILAALNHPDVVGDDLDLKGLAARVLDDPQTTAADKARGALFRSSKWLTDTTPMTPPGRSGWTQVDPAHPVMVDYAASDVLDTAALRVVLEAADDLPADLLERERRTQVITARVTERGLALDSARLAEMVGVQQAHADELLAQIRAAGVDNPGSTKQLGERLMALGATLPRTPPSARFPNGQVSTAGAILDELAMTSGPAADLARLVVGQGPEDNHTPGWRDHDKVVSTFLRPFSVQDTYGDGRIRPTVYTLGAAATGRMSCVRPNIQQLPRAGGIRECVVADPGYRLVSADFASIEVRVAAWVSGDLGLAAMIRDGLDMHALIAKQVYGEGYSKADRYHVKRAVFGRLYGSGIGGIARNLGITEATAQTIVDTLDQITPQLSAWSHELNQRVRRGVVTFWQHPSGRKTWFPKDTPHKAVNYVVQSTARELLVDALLAVDDLLPGVTVVPIHDELMLHVPEPLAEYAKAVLVQCMTMSLPMSDGSFIPVACEPSEPSVCWKSAT